MTLSFLGLQGTATTRNRAATRMVTSVGRGNNCTVLDPAPAQDATGNPRSRPAPGERGGRGASLRGCSRCRIVGIFPAVEMGFFLTWRVGRGSIYMSITRPKPAQEPAEAGMAMNPTVGEPGVPGSGNAKPNHRWRASSCFPGGTNGG